MVSRFCCPTVCHGFSARVGGIFGPTGCRCFRWGGLTFFRPERYRVCFKPRRTLRLVRLATASRFKINHRLLHSPRAGSTDGRWRRRSGHTRLDMQNFDRAIRLIRTCRKGERDHGAGNNALCRTPRWRAKCATTKTASVPSRGCRSRRQSPLHHISGLQSSVQLHRQ